MPPSTWTAWDASDVDGGGLIPDHCEEWARSRDEIVRFDVDQVDIRKRPREDVYLWDWVHSVTFRDGQHLQVPLFGEFPRNEGERDAAARFWAQLAPSA